LGNGIVGVERVITSNDSRTEEGTSDYKCNNPSEIIPANICAIELGNIYYRLNMNSQDISMVNKAMDNATDGLYYIHQMCLVLLLQEIMNCTLNIYTAKHLAYAK
jgi:hypothetical protein